METNVTAMRGEPAPDESSKLVCRSAALC